MIAAHSRARLRCNTKLLTCGARSNAASRRDLLAARRCVNASF
jgi:hypothetical protein